MLAWLAAERAFFSADAALVGKAGPRESLERGCCKTLCCGENVGPRIGSGTSSGLPLRVCSPFCENMRGSEPATRQWVQDQPQLETQCKSRKWVSCWEMGDAFTQILGGGADL